MCHACWAGVTWFTPPFCQRCGLPLASWRSVARSTGACLRCRLRAGAVDRARSAGLYDGRLRDIVHALKYGRHFSLARRLGGAMREVGEPLLEGADGVVPVPLHPARYWARGFNQSEELSRQLGLPVLSTLRRTRRTASQSGLTAAARRRNVRGAFAVVERFGTLAVRWPFRLRAGRPAGRATLPLEDRCLVLVDDVMTTGATLEACALALKRAGAREVRALTAARAVGRSWR